MSATVDFWLPARARGLVSGYHRYRLVDADPGMRFDDVFFPAWSNIRFTVDAAPWSVRLARRNFDPVPHCAFFGPSSYAGYVSAGAGTLVGIGLTPAGWAMFHGGDISPWANRIAPLGDVFSDLSPLCDELRATDDPAGLFDRVLLERLKAPLREGAAIDSIMAGLLDPAVVRVEDLGAAHGLSPRQIARLTRTCFGFTPKLLLRRARFLRAVEAVRSIDRGLWKTAIADAGYWDGSHFLRDCHLFLGMPLGDFMAMARPINRASMRRRDEVLGAPMQSLYVPETA